MTALDILRGALLGAIVGALSAAACAACDLGGSFKSEEISGLFMPIPDQGSISSPPIVLDHPSYLEVVDLAVGVEIEHSWSGDVRVTLIHTPDNGPPNTATCRLFDMPGGGSCDADLIWQGHEYQFQDGFGPYVCGDGPGQCDDPMNGELSDFHGIRGDEGTWWLSIEDTQALDTGVFHGWTLYLVMGPIISVEENTWGQVKARYRP